MNAPQRSLSSRNILVTDLYSAAPARATHFIYTQGEWWGASINRFLLTRELLANKAEARKVRMRATRYTIQSNELYKRSFSRPLLCCLAHSEADYVLREIHEGICENHAGGCFLANKVLRTGYY